MLGLRSLGQRGDTIIEVLVALAILGSALSIGMATASQGLTKSRTAQEHSQAQQYLEAQVEMLRRAAPSYNVAASNVYTSNTFCMVTNGTDNPVRADFAAGYTRPASVDDDLLVAATPPTPLAPYPDSCVVGNGLYFVSILYDQYTDSDATPDDLFTVSIRWEGPGGLGRQQASMTYKIHEPAASVAPPVIIPPVVPPVVPPVIPPAPVCPNSEPTNQFAVCYYSDKTLTTFAHDATEPMINHTWGAGSPDASVPNDNFSALWKSKWFLAPGKYKFTATSSDGVMVFVDGVKIIDKYFDQSTNVYTAIVDISGSAAHPISMQYYEATGDATAILKWELLPNNVAQGKAIRNDYPCTPVSMLNNPKILDGDRSTASDACDNDFDYIIDLQGLYNLSSITAVWGGTAAGIDTGKYGFDPYLYNFSMEVSSDDNCLTDGSGTWSDVIRRDRYAGDTIGYSTTITPATADDPLVLTSPVRCIQIYGFGSEYVAMYELEAYGTPVAP